MNLNSTIIPLKKIAVGWSGGIDSTAVLLWLKKNNYDVEAWHIDHAWRPESKEEFIKLQNICDKMDVPLIHKRLEHAKSDNNKECVARVARYDQFKAWSIERGVDFICLGHHIADQAETTFMRLLSGSGVHGCSGMKDTRKHGLTIIRPALSIYKEDMEKYLIENNIVWIEDPSNNDNVIKRNSVRNVMFPAMSKKGTDPVSLFNRLSIQAKRISKEIEEIVNCIPFKSKENEISIEAKTWMGLSPLIKKFLLQKMGRTLLDDGFSFGRKHLEYAASWKGLHGIDLTKTRLQRNKNIITLRCS